MRIKWEKWRKRCEGELDNVVKSRDAVCACCGLTAFRAHVREEGSFVIFLFTPLTKHHCQIEGKASSVLAAQRKATEYIEAIVEDMS